MTVTDLFGSHSAPPRPTGPHQTATVRSDVWLTPQWLLAELGHFDLDPCAAPDPRPWPTADRHYVEADGDGLARPWEGRVWMNPPYSNVPSWLARLAGHGRGTALVFARTETEAFHRWVWPKATGVLFPAGRVTFCTPGGRPGRWNGGAPSVLIAYGDDDADVLEGCRLDGAFIRLPQRAMLTEPQGVLL